VAKCEGFDAITYEQRRIATRHRRDDAQPRSYQPSTNWAQGGPIIERENITIIRANDEYECDEKGFTTLKRIPQWFAETSQWTGHSTTTSYEGENMEPTFMVEEEWGCYGPTPLIAAMRCYVASKLGEEVEAPEELLDA